MQTITRNPNWEESLPLFLSFNKKFKQSTKMIVTVTAEVVQSGSVTELLENNFSSGCIFKELVIAFSVISSGFGSLQTVLQF